jgi:hypothetical protein
MCMHLHEFTWIHMNSNQFYLNLYWFTWILTWLYFKLSDLFRRIYTNLYEYVFNLFENMLTAGLPHTAAPLDSRTLPRAQPDSHTLSRIPPYIAARTAGHSCALCRTMPHTAWFQMPDSRTPLTAHRTTVAHRRQHDFKQVYVNVYAFKWN